MMKSDVSISSTSEKIYPLQIDDSHEIRFHSTSKSLRMWQALGLVFVKARRYLRDVLYEEKKRGLFDW
jgi:hypothetical protein